MMKDKNGNEVQKGDHVICEWFPGKFKIGRILKVHGDRCRVDFDSAGVTGITSDRIEKNARINYPHPIDLGIMHVGDTERKYLDQVELQLIPPEKRFLNKLGRKS